MNFLCLETHKLLLLKVYKMYFKSGTWFMFYISSIEEVNTELTTCHIKKVYLTEKRIYEVKLMHLEESFVVERYILLQGAFPWLE